MANPVDWLTMDRTFRRRALRWSAAGWMAVALFWLIATRSFHPSWTLAMIVTGSLIVAYSSASYLNHLILIPRYFRTRQYGRYSALLLAIMLTFTGAALAVIRVAYFRLHGPDPDPNGAIKHYFIDLFGMAVHLTAAALVAWAAGRRLKMVS